MKLHWTPEKDGSVILRDEKRAARAIVPKCGENGFSGILLEPGLLESGPYEARVQAQLWCQHMVKKDVFPDAEFSPIY